jgi:hypothetical protein
VLGLFIGSTIPKEKKDPVWSKKLVTGIGFHQAASRFWISFSIRISYRLRKVKEGKTVHRIVWR